MKTRIALLVMAMAGAFASGCANTNLARVKPWERDILSRPDMALDASPVDAAFDEHVYFSKESASGGRGFGGGGCGCSCSDRCSDTAALDIHSG